MNKRTVTFTLQTADRTRIAQVTVPRDARASDVIRTGAKRWSLGLGVHYQLANVSTGRLLLGNDGMSGDKVNDGDTLVLQPLPTHGKGR